MARPWGRAASEEVGMRMSRRTSAVAAAGVVALAGQLGAATGAGAVTDPWKLIPTTNLGIIDVPSVAHFGSDLQIVWTQNSETQLRTAVVNSGLLKTAALAPLPSWASVDQNPAVFANGRRRVIAFSGLRSTDTTDPFTSGAMYYLTSTDGRTWSLSSGSFSSSKSAYGSYGGDATSAGSVPIDVFTAATAHAISFHVGFDAANPSTRPDGHTADTGPDAYEPGVAYDSFSKQAWAAWYSNSGKPATDGINAQRIYPTVGPRLHAAYSTVSANGAASSLAPDQTVGIAARSASKGGGMYVAYVVGYPTATTVALLRLGSSRPMIVATGTGVADVGVAAAPGGKLWLYWHDVSSTGSLHAVLTNATATAFGKVLTIARPQGAGTIWKMVGDASLGPLELVVTADVNGATKMYYRRIAQPA
jgi:hypothetical protein